MISSGRLSQNIKENSCETSKTETFENDKKFGFTFVCLPRVLTKNGLVKYYRGYGNGYVVELNVR